MYDYVCIYEYVCRYICMYVCMYVCMYIYISVWFYLYTYSGLQALRRLESLSLAHNFLSIEALVKDGPLSSLKHLKRLDLSYNLLTSIPAVVFLLSKWVTFHTTVKTCYWLLYVIHSLAFGSIETLVLVENNIQQLPNSLSVLKKLTTLWWVMITNVQCDDAVWCYMMQYDVLWCRMVHDNTCYELMMQCDVLWCVMMQNDAMDVLWCIWCVMMNMIQYDVLWCNMMQYDVLCAVSYMWYWFMSHY